MKHNEFEVLKTLMATATTEQLNDIVGMFNQRRDAIEREATSELNVDDKVMWISPKNSEMHTGVIMKVNRKTVLVRSRNQRYRVSPTLLKKHCDS